ncbi:hypothetical protein AVEN_87185-1 [Araneus ventricosus]|uniref:Uncharacterized protein n=1 Tax=Araneus ventricosus TaxID=182803 RepID=A0A4Y2VVP1_ARAVE|nr:hypothetical protein AVEN_87185-1 [Araneus ventricosus]
MTRKTPELAPPLQTSALHQQEDVWPPVYYKGATDPIHDGSSVESGFEPGILRLRGRHLTTRTPRAVPNRSRKHFATKKKSLPEGSHGFDHMKT